MPGTWPAALIHAARRYRLEAGFVAGLLAGLLFGEGIVWVRPLGELFLVALKLLGPPLALLVLVSALVSMSGGKLGRLGLKSASWYLLTALAAATIGVTVASVLGAGSGLSLGDASGTLALQPGRDVPPTQSWVARMGALIHGPVMIAAFIAGFVVIFVAGWRRSSELPGNRGWRRLLDHGTQAAFRMLAWVMVYAPVGVFAITAVTVAGLRLTSATALLTILLAVYLAQVAVCIGCLLIVQVRLRACGVFLRAVRDALLTALVSGSSAATVPLEFRALEQGLGMPRAQVGVVLPLGLAMHKLGTAVHQAVILVFAATAMGQAPTLAWSGGLVLLAVLASAITPPVSGGSAVALTLVFGWIGLPLEAIALGIAIPLLGKLNTPLNSLGRLVSAVALVDRSGRQASEGAAPAP
ncbi:MAG: dicarboxylate/amino acid:cation symporter [Pseudomonadota bacterium]|nr:dicarboxylate/amino acid:cation symporter [Pseudomonadota bacterium]